MQASDLVAVIDAMLEGLQVLGPDWRYLHVNDAAARQGRTTREALLGRTILECYPGVERTRLFALMQEVMTTRTPRAFDNEFEFADGTRGHFELRIEPVPQGICILSMDRTEARQAEVAKALAEDRLRNVLRMESVGRLAAGLAHDFNNMLTVVLGHCQLALARPEGPLAEDVAAVLAAGETAALMTKRLLSFGRRRDGGRRPADLVATLRNMQPLLVRIVGPRIELKVAVADGIGAVALEPFQLEQMLVNLVLNARDAIGGAGAIEIRATPVLARRERATDGGDQVDAPQPQVCLHVIDTGIGMEPETIARIFDPFFTTKGPGRGTGLGLVAVRDILTEHGGRVEVSSEPGKGTEFRVFLPCPEPSASTVDAAPSRASAPATILLVEDAPEVAGLMRRVLMGRLHSVRVAASSKEALQLFREEKARFDLLVTDLTIRDIPTADFIGSVRQERPSLPVVCTTRYGGGGRRRLAGIANVAWLDKPFTPEQLLASVDAALAGPHDGGSEAKGAAGSSAG